MAFDQTTRNRLQRFVSDARSTLTEEFTRQLQNEYGLDPVSASVTPMERLSNLDDARRETARILRETLDHYRQTSPSEDLGALLDRIVREHAFTTLNRLAALRMAEARGLLIESLAEGYNSKGFQLYARLAGTGLGERGDAYRAYLFSIFDEFALDLRPLFDRFSPTGRLFPREPALLETLALMNDPEVAPLWAEDETIGWIYQYFNSKEERRKMREESAAPRNSRELAVRNQFFTPRYVVEFLTDNTLGRIWYEMTRGETRLKDQCRYLVCRPTEIFLKPGEGPPASDESSEQNLSQEELLRQPVFILHRPLKDPREIRVLDPACGSMHFGLYAFDLLEAIYEEAWDLEDSDVAPFIERSSELKPLRETYPDKQEFLRDVPRLIIEHNLHGIDIDPRAVQIAGLSLWLRAQRSWQRQNVKAADRPRIRRSNIVCAEPMPGEESLLDEFIERHLSATPELRLIAQLVRRVFKAMKLAGEAGSLLKIEEEMARAVAEAKVQWLGEVKQESGQGSLFADLAKHEQQRLDFEVAEITDETFWERAESSIYAALREYAEHAENGGGYQRRLFAEDAARGFAFIDICGEQYDVALMNPPFGDASLPSKPYLDETYGDTKGDVYKAFVECFQSRLVPAGYLGIISSRTGFFLGQSEDWRTRVVLRLFRPIVLADLGMGVLDAMVEVAAYVLRNLSEPETRDLTLSLVPMLEKVERDRQDRFSLPKWQVARNGLKRHQAVGELEHLADAGFIQRYPSDIVRYTPLWHMVKTVMVPPYPGFPPFVCIRVLAERDKGSVLMDAISRSVDRRVFACNPRQFSRLPRSTFAYWSSERVFSLFDSLPSLAESGRIVRTTNPTTDDFRFARAWWEPLAGNCGRWRSWNKGGGFSPFYRDIEMVIDWDEKRSTYRGYIGTVYRPDVRPANLEYFSRPGLTWVYRGHRLCVQAMPAGTVISTRGNGIYADEAILRFDLGLLNSATADCLIKLTLGRSNHPQFDIGDINTIPVPPVDASVSRMATRAWALKRNLETYNEISHAFVVPNLLAEQAPTLAERAAAWAARVHMSEETVAAIQAEIDGFAFHLYGLDAADRVALTATLATEATGDDEVGEDEEEEATTTDAPALAADLLVYALGCAFGRWDIRFATGEKSAPELPDLFAPLPVYPPGMLQNELGRPAAPSDVPSSYPLRISWPGILVDDKGHAEDIERRVREALQVIWRERADAIEQEACEILSVNTLRDYFRKPAGFFADHLKRYSKSRRQAPIYWPLSTRSGEYTLWLYYHRLDDQTLYSCVNNFVEPKLRQVSKEVNELRIKGAARSREEEREFERLQDFEQELQEFRDELLRLARLPWRPDLNDGVQITAAPLWSLFRLPKWQKTLKETWQSLEKGDYDWAHLAMTVWPHRVTPKCAKDRSLAIAHGVEDLFWVEDEGRWRALQSPEIEEQKRRRRSESRERVKNLLCEMARGEDGASSAADVGSRLEAGDYDDRELALLLYPKRMAEKCWEDVALARRLGLSHPAKRTKAAREKFIKEIVARGCAEIAPMIVIALDGRARSFAEVWREIESGERDDLTLALSLWPDRVVERCAEDVVLAKCHGLRKFFWVQHPTEEWRRRLSIEEEISNEVAWWRCIAAGLVG